jgi:hypothetical protein
MLLFAWQLWVNLQPEAALCETLAIEGAMALRPGRGSARDDMHSNSESSGRISDFVI